MNKPRISAIAAIGRNRELGKDNGLIWKLNDDFERMKALIKGHVLVMGRKTYESIGTELPYPSVVISRDRNYISPYKNTKNTYKVVNLEEAIDKAMDLEMQNRKENREIFIFGGAKVYEDALPLCERLYLTIIDADEPAADAFFPPYEDFMNIVEETTHHDHGVHYRMLTLERPPEEVQ